MVSAAVTVPPQDAKQGTRRMAQVQGVKDSVRRAAPATQGRDGPLLVADGVTLQYKTSDHLVTATWRVGFEVFAGERFVVLGPSGCGKSTLLKAIAGFMQPVEGVIRLAGAPITRPGSDRMMVFQEFDQLLPWKTVLGNVMFPLVVNRRMTRGDAKAHARELLGKVNLSRFEHVFPHMLSGGMKQRTAIARALAMEPKVLLIDEPLLVGSRILVLSPHPGRVKAELNAHHLGFESIGSPEFEALHRRIHDLLFADKIEIDLAPEAAHG